MTSHPLSVLPERLEQIGATLSEFLHSRHGQQAGEALARAGIIRPEVVPLLQQPESVELGLDLFAVQAVYGDCLTLVPLACLNARQGVVYWERLEGLRPLLQRIGSFLATMNPRYRDFRALPREKMGELLQAFAAGTEPFGLLFPGTHFQGLRLCLHVARQLPRDVLLRSYLNEVLRPIWQYASSRVEVNTDLAGEVWSDIQARADRP
jgi:hypothetical protein